MSPRLSKLAPIFLYISVFLIYLHNLSRSIYGGDVGDLVTAAKVMGVPHAPGYPLFTFLGFLLTRIDLVSPAFMVGLISATSASLAVLLYYFLSLKLTKNIFISLISAFILSFSYLFWLYAEVGEVFALNNLFVVALIFVAYLFYKEKKIKYFYLLSFLTGLSLTNHHTITLIFPSLFILVLVNIKILIKQPKTILVSLLLAVSGLLAYIYVPIASFTNPPINWDHVNNLDSFLRLVLRKDYGTFSAGMFEQPSFAQRLIILQTYFSYLLSQLTIPVVILILLGAIKVFLKDKILFISLLIGFILTGPLFIVYAGFPLISSFYIGIYERFFSMSLVVALFFLPVGLLFFIEGINKLFRKKTFQNLFIFVFMIIPFSLFYYNFPKTDLSNLWIGNDLAYDLLAPAPPNAVVFIGGDTGLFNSWYMKYALNFRQDIQLVNLSGLSDDEFINRQKDLYLKINPEIKDSKDLMANVIRYIGTKRPVVSYQQVQPSKGDKIVWIPYGLGYEMLKPGLQIPLEQEFIVRTEKTWSGFKYLKDLKNQNLASGSLTLSEIPSYYANALLATGTFMISQYKDNDTALKYYKSAKAITPEYYKVYQVMGAYYLSLGNKCVEADNFLTKSIDLYPFDKLPYFLLYTDYRECLKDTNKEKMVVREYEKLFKTSFSKDIKNAIKTINK